MLLYGNLRTMKMDKRATSKCIQVSNCHLIMYIHYGNIEKGTLVRKSTVAEDYFDTLLVVFWGREAPSKSSQSVPCIVRDGTIHRFGGVCALCGAPWASQHRPRTEQSLYLHRALLFPQNVVHVWPLVCRLFKLLVAWCPGLSIVLWLAVSEVVCHSWNVVHVPSFVQGFFVVERQQTWAFIRV